MAPAPCVVIYGALILCDNRKPWPAAWANEMR